ncbi:hypothetical protein KAW43_02075 [Candidatus Parcubacteria bacterium]|nr:hypothetical protein [Candidatus Parcubacteria bacterium]
MIKNLKKTDSSSISFVANESIWINYSDKSITVSLTIHNPGGETMNLYTKSKTGEPIFVGSIPPHSTKTITVTIPANHWLYADQPGSYKPVGTNVSSKDLAKLVRNVMIENGNSSLVSVKNFGKSRKLLKINKSKK